MEMSFPEAGNRNEGTTSRGSVRLTRPVLTTFNIEVLVTHSEIVGHFWKIQSSGEKPGLKTQIWELKPNITDESASVDEIV